MKKLLTGILLCFGLNFTYAEDLWKNAYDFTKFSQDKTAYNLRKDIDYFELRTYVFDREGKQLSPKYLRYFSAGSKKLEDYSFEIQKRFSHIGFINTPETNIRNYNGEGCTQDIFYKSNGYIIKKDKTILQMNEKKDVLWVFDKIDRAKELLEFSSMNIVKEGNSYVRYNYQYRKVNGGYEIKEEKIEDNTVAQSKEECHTLYVTTIYSVNKNGSIDSKVISTRRKAEEWLLSDEFIASPSCIEESIEQKVDRVVNRYSHFISPKE
ncbi:MAG TPA: hypothetical protein ENK66_04115 [Arcobacter sp.]|nr:hypothetical protein [Arcobacter sp.]